MTWQEKEEKREFEELGVEETLMILLFEDRIEASVDEEGEFIFWMNDAQKKWFGEIVEGENWEMI